MSEQDLPLPPVPEHTPPLKEDEVGPGPGKYFNQVWNRWFTSLRTKVNVINDAVTALSKLIGNGIVVVDGGVATTVSTTDLIAGTNVSFDTSGTDRILDNGAGPLTINAAGGGGGGGLSPSTLALMSPRPDLIGNNVLVGGPNIIFNSPTPVIQADPLAPGEAVVVCSGVSGTVLDTGVSLPGIVTFSIECLFDFSSGGGVIASNRSASATGWRIMVVDNTRIYFSCVITSWADTILDATGLSMTVGERYYLKIDRSGTVLRMLFGPAAGPITVVDTATVHATNRLVPSGTLRLGVGNSSTESLFTGRIKQFRFSSIIIPDTIPPLPWT
jgi:hypothetical protein